MFYVIKLIVFMVNVIMQIVIMVKVIMLSAIILIVIMLNVVAPTKPLKHQETKIDPLTRVGNAHNYL